MRLNFKFIDSEGIEINCYKWFNEKNTNPKAIIQLSHGMAEHIERYDRFANALIDEDYIVYGHDHRGHGYSAKSHDELGYMSEEDNFMAMLMDLRELNLQIKKEHPGIDIVLFGHSMGSFLAQRYVEMYGSELRALILSGTNGRQKPIVNVGICIAKMETVFFGRKKTSNIMDGMSFGNFNGNFKPCRTDFDWLTRDNDEVDKYIRDPLCGKVFTCSYFYDFMRGLKAIHKKENLSNIPKELPIYIFGGEKDPVGYNGKGVFNLVNTLTSLGIKDVKYKLYRDGRHEMLNETNREEVFSDVIKYLNGLFDK